MEVRLTSYQKAFVRRAVECGRLLDEEDAVREALSLWEDRERGRVEFLASLDRSVIERALMAHRVAPEAEADPDDIWLYVATHSGSMDVATRQIESITDRFSFLSGFPYAGRTRSGEFGPGIPSFAAGDYVLVNCIEGDDVLILRVVHGKRHLENLVGHVV